MGFRSQHQDAPAFALVIICNQAAFRQQQRTEILIRRPHPDHAATRRIELAYFRNTSTQLRADVLHEITFVLDQVSIINVELDLPSRCASANLRTGAPSPNDHEVLTQSLHVLFLVHAETKPQPYQKNYRCDSPHDAEHREERAHLVSAERSERLAQDFENSHTLIAGNDA